MVTVEHIGEVAARLREEGFTAIADELATAHEGVFSGTELAMKWRFHLAEARKLRALTAHTQGQVEHLWCELQAVLS